MLWPSLGRFGLSVHYTSGHAIEYTAVAQSYSAALSHVLSTLASTVQKPKRTNKRYFRTLLVLPHIDTRGRDCTWVMRLWTSVNWLSRADAKGKPLAFADNLFAIALDVRLVLATFCALPCQSCILLRVMDIKFNNEKYVVLAVLSRQILMTVLCLVGVTRHAQPINLTRYLLLRT